MLQFKINDKSSFLFEVNIIDVTLIEKTCLCTTDLLKKTFSRDLQSLLCGLMHFNVKV